MRRVMMILAAGLSLTACDPMSMMPNNQPAFADQGFKTTVALVELHHTRNGEYPASLDALEYTGQWDPIFHEFVAYRKMDRGYGLNVSTDMAEKLDYPAGFFSGLGLAATNVGGFRQARQ